MNVFETVTNLKVLVGENFLELARELRTIRETAPEVYEEVVSGVGLGRRKAYYLLSLEAILQSLGIPDERLLKIGWTKLNLVRPYLSQETYKDLLSLAEARSSHDLTILLRGEIPVKNPKVVIMHFAPEDYPVIRQAAVKFGAVENGEGLLYWEPAITKMATALLKSADQAAQGDR